MSKATTISELHCLIEKERAKMHQLSLKFGYNDKKILQQSEFSYKGDEVLRR